MSVDPPPPIGVGSRLGHFTITGVLGAGGMGEVFAAEDTRLNRQVALKVVRREVADDPVRRARLVREATAVARLNHPHIVTVHSLEEFDGVLFIAMERIDGVTLAEALPENGFPLERVMSLAIQLADALAAAHALGIVHRDLKPANIMISRDGVLKVLDFGLSRLAVDPDRHMGSIETLTVDGSVTGTVPYMSPEQIEGEEADQRSDLFSMGIVLFELATGRRPFNGKTTLATLTAIVKDPPADASLVNPGVPRELARVIDRCLVKERTKRMQAAVDLRAQLEDLSRLFESRNWVSLPAPGTRFHEKPAPGFFRRFATPLVMAAVVLSAAGAAATWSAARWARAPLQDGRVVRFVVNLPADSAIVAEFNPHIALSPDGSELAITPLPGPLLVRRLDALDNRPLSAADAPGFRFWGAPLFSPNGSSIAFIEGNSTYSAVRPFYTASLSGGAPLKLADYDAFHRGDWSDDGWIYWTDRYPGAIVRMPAGGGEVQPVTALNAQAGERSHRFASVLPDNRGLVYTVGYDGIGSYDDARIDLWDLKTKTHKTLVAGGTAAAYAGGYLVYARAGKLLAVPFDARRQEVTGQPFEALDGVLTSGNTGAAEFSLSRHGDLAYVPGTATGGHRTLVWVDRTGKATPLPLPSASYLYPRLSPDGRSIAVEIEGPNHDLYVYDLARAILTKITTDGQSHDPVWAPDSKRLAFRSWVAGGMTMWMMPADRSAPPSRLDPSGTRQSPVSFSPDGRFLSFDQKDRQTGDDAWVLPLEAGAKPTAIAQSRFGEGSAKFSPDGRSLAYASTESGKAQVYVQPFPGPGPKLQVSRDGGFDPVWRRSGGELYYRSDNKMMSVSISTSPRLEASAPKVLWEAEYSDGAASSCGMPGVSSSNYDVTADGQRFLMVRDDDANVAGTRVVVVLNWIEELQQRARVAAAPVRTAAR
ncbi:MAG TPA: protein kinase [Vicinamibacterales bacterium]|nr:protein kinase [Vicinamibacterales bacterium]